jgi:DNA-3-methyladenine glycosylase
MIGATLALDGIGGIVVETEAYRPDDPASHAFGGKTRRNAAMFGPPGTAYIYRSYGLHWCLNAVCLPGSAVLIRAIEPRFGIAAMQANRGLADVRLLCSGPGRLCQALRVDMAQSGLALMEAPFEFGPAPSVDASLVLSGPRIGISKAVEAEWRFGLRGSPYLSRRF